MPNQPTQLPLFQPVADGPSVAWLDLVDAAGVPVMAQGRGAPLELRLAIGDGPRPWRPSLAADDFTGGTPPSRDCGVRRAFQRPR